MSFILIVCDKVIWQLQRYLRKLNSLDLYLFYLRSQVPVFKNNNQKELFHMSLPDYGLNFGQPSFTFYFMNVLFKGAEGSAHKFRLV